jgi:threonine dehydrogenase-like Zn-dependent dehydrogenase
MIWKDHEFGHEAISEVKVVGKNVRDLQLGDHVFVNQGKALRDMSRMATVGGFSEYIRIARCEVGYSVLKIDNEIPVKTAVLLEPFVIGARAAKELNPDLAACRIEIGRFFVCLCESLFARGLSCGSGGLIGVV